MRLARQQGQADGLCGLYAILNFLRHTEAFASDEDEDVLRYLLDACRHFGWFNPHSLICGFEEHQIQAIIELQIANYLMPYRTFRVGQIDPKSRSTSKVLIDQISASDGFLITGTPKHWFLVVCRQLGSWVFDSAAGPEPVPLEKRRYSKEQGVIILPSDRRYSKISD